MATSPPATPPVAARRLRLGMAAYVLATGAGLLYLLFRFSGQ